LDAPGEGMVPGGRERERERGERGKRGKVATVYAR
jgi:hypothetical protein